MSALFITRPNNKSLQISSFSPQKLSAMD